MAHMIPEEPPPRGPGRDAERLLFEALRDGLGEEYFVYHGLRYVDEEEAREGEADFLILHRERGLLVVECKGQGVRRTRTGAWVRLGPNGEEPLKRSPFAQAQRHVKDLQRQLEPRLAREFPHLEGFPFVTGHAVAFPKALLAEAGPLPLDTPRVLVLDASDLDAIGERIDALHAFWRKAAARRVPVLDPRELKRFRRKLLHPALSLVECLGAAVRSEARALHRLSDEQVRAVEGWLDNPRLRVRGGAGTGKTVIALEAARRLAEGGANVLLLCFNRRLGEHLAETVEGWEGAEGRVQATTFHRLCARASWLVTDEALPVPEDQDEAVRYWRDDAPLVLLEALEAGKLDRFDAIVVDEGQDFAPSWWSVLEELLREKGRMLAFYDPHQEIFGRGCHVPETWPLLGLTRNFRNTRRIAEAVCRVGGVEMRSCDGCPEGRPPEVRPLESRPKMQKHLDALVRHLVEVERLAPEQIAILTPHSRKRSSCADCESLAGLPLADDPGKRQGAVLHTTISAFKGLESDVVVLADIDPKDPRCDRNARYVAASRARHLLYVFSRGDWIEGA